MAEIDYDEQERVRNRNELIGSKIIKIKLYLIAGLLLLTVGGLYALIYVLYGSDASNIAGGEFLFYYCIFLSSIVPSFLGDHLAQKWNVTDPKQYTLGGIKRELRVPWLLTATFLAITNVVLNHQVDSDALRVSLHLLCWSWSGFYMYKVYNKK